MISHKLEIHHVLVAAWPFPLSSFLLCSHIFPFPIFQHLSLGIKISFSKANRKPHIKEIQTAITTTNKQTIKQNRTLPSPFLALCLNSLLLDFCTVYQKTKHNFCCLNSTSSINMAVKVKVKVTSPVPESLSSVHSISVFHC